MNPNQSLHPTRPFYATWHLKENKNISNNTSSFIKDPVIIWGINNRYYEVVSLGTVTISILCLIYLRILHNVIPKSFLSWEVCCMYLLWWYYSTTAPELYMSFYSYGRSSYNGVCIDLFVYVIQSKCWLYFILGILSYISTMHGSFHHCIILTYEFTLICLWILYLCLFQYVFVLYLV